MSYGYIYSSGAKKDVPPIIRKNEKLHIMLIQNLRTLEIIPDHWEPLKSEKSLVSRKTGPCDENNQPTWETWEVIKTMDVEVMGRVK